jgi:hypothetical protein
MLGCIFGGVKMRGLGALGGVLNIWIGDIMGRNGLGMGICMASCHYSSFICWRSLSCMKRCIPLVSVGKSGCS